MKPTSLPISIARFASAARAFILPFAAGLTLAVTPASAAPIYPGSQVVRTSPGNMVGRFLYRLGDGSAETYVDTAFLIKGSSVLTSAYNLYDSNTGWTTRHSFRLGVDPTYPSGLTGAAILGRSVYALTGYRSAVSSHGTWSDQALAADGGGVILWHKPAGGGALPWAASGSTYLRDSRTSKQLLGYGAENGNDSHRMLRDKSHRPSTQVAGSLFRSTAMAAEYGMIGGPVLGHLNGKWTVIGIIVGRERDQRYSGALIRATDSMVSSLITYLR